MQSYTKGMFKKTHYFQKNCCKSCHFAKRKNVQAHEIGGLALQKKKNRKKNSVDHAYYWYER